MEKYVLTLSDQKLIAKIKAKKPAQVLKDIIDDDQANPALVLEDGSNLADLAETLDHVSALQLLAQFNVFPKVKKNQRIKYELSKADHKLIEKIKARKPAQVLKDIIEDDQANPSLILEDGMNLADLAKSLDHLSALQLLA